MNASLPIEPFYDDRSESIATNANDTPFAAQNFVPFHAKEAQWEEEKKISLAYTTKKSRTIRNDHSRVTLTSFLTRKTHGIDRKTAVCTIFFSLGHGIRCFRKARRDPKKDEEKVYSSDGFPQGSRGWLFFSRSVRDPRSWSLEIYGAAPLSRNQIFKDKAGPADSWSHVSRAWTKIPRRSLSKVELKTQPHNSHEHYQVWQK